MSIFMSTELSCRPGQSLTARYVSLTSSLPLLLFLLWSQRSIELEHSLGQPHSNALTLDIKVFQVRLSVGNLQLSVAFPDDEQRSLTRAEPHVFDPANLARAIANRTANQIAD